VEEGKRRVSAVPFVATRADVDCCDCCCSCCACCWLGCLELLPTPFVAASAAEPAPEPAPVPPEPALLPPPVEGDDEGSSMGEGEGWVRASRIHACFNPSSGVMRSFASQRRQPSKKSKNNLSLHFRTCASVFDAGFRFLPRELGTTRTAKLPSKKSFLRVELSTNDLGGKPIVSIIHSNCSVSFSPGNSGYPVYNSANIQPRLHMSMDLL